MEENNEQWHLDKRVPIALIFTIAFQSLCAVWWAASVDARMTSAEKTITGLIASISTSRDKELLTSERLVRLETTLENMDKRLESIVLLLERKILLERKK